MLPSLMIHKRISTWAFIAIALGGCATPVASAIDEAEANRIVLALDHAGIGSTKDSDPTSEGHFRVSVAPSDVASALHALRAEELPRAKPLGVLDAVGKGSLVPSPSAEQAQISVAIAGELERSLSGIDGVLQSRVHLQIPASEPFSDSTQREKPTASVLIEHRGATPPLGEGAVARIVAGAVTNLAPANVAVVFVSRPTQATAQTSALAPLGPFSVARTSVRGLQIVGSCLLVALAMMGSLLIVLYLRTSRLKSELQALASEAARGGRS